MKSHYLSLITIIKNVLHSCNDELYPEPNWTFVLQLAREQNLFALALEEAVKHSSYLLRPGSEQEMHMVTSAVILQTKRTQAFLKLYQDFVRDDLHPIVLKGLICRKLYGKLEDHRPSGDEDILIQPEEYVRAKAVLVANGYLPKFETETEEQLEELQEITYFNQKEALYIELHLNPMGRENEIRSRMSDCFKDVFENYREVMIEGTPVRTMNHQEHLLFLILHAFKHFTGGGCGIRQMLDILMYQQQFGSEIDLQQLYEKLCEFHANTFWSDMLHLGNSYLGFNLWCPEEANCPTELLMDMIRSGVFGNKTQADVTAARMTMIATGDYHERKSVNTFVTLIRTVFPKKSMLVNQFPYLEEKPWLLPIEWLKRWGRFIKRSSKSERNLAIDSMKINRRRMKLLRNYDLV